jgi:hypothetical protein
MKYRKLPVQIELENLLETQGQEAMLAARHNIFMETLRTKGFQLITALLREREMRHLVALRLGASNVLETLGSLKEIDSLRSALEILVPVPERGNVDWFDDAEETFNIEAPSDPGA